MATGTSFRQLWLVGVLIVVSAYWPTGFRSASEPAGQPLVGATVTRPVGARPANHVGRFLQEAHLRAGRDR